MASPDSGHAEPVPRSAMPGIVWPAVPDGRGAQALALQYQLAQSQWWPPERVSAWQLRQLGLLVRHARDTVPYYRGRLPQDLLDADGVVRPEAWAEVPVLSRAAVQSSGSALTSGFIPRAHGPVSIAKTSGSTGRPVEVAMSALMATIWNAVTLRDHLWHRRDLSAKLAAIRFPHGDPIPLPGVRQQGWGAATDEAFATGECVALDIRTDVAEQVPWLAQENPEYLLSYPSNVLALAEAFAAGERRLPRLREVRTVSEMVPAELRDLCRRVWGAALTDVYSIQECGYLALQCPQHEHYHVQSEGVLLELLDERDRPCAPGQVGRVVVTPLHNFATVLLRYEIGDYAEAGAPCPCGRGLPVLTRILGRYRNLAIYPDGRRSWPKLGQMFMRDVAPIGQMQVVQHSLEDMELRYTAERELDEAEKARLAGILQESMGHPFRIALTRLPSIPRSAGGKYEDFVCEVPVR